MRKILFLSIFFLLNLTYLCAQTNPVKWSFEAEKVGNNEYEIIATADIQDGWSVYSNEMKSGEGPIPTQVMIDKDTDLKLVGDLKEIGAKKKVYDDLFEMELVKLSGRTSFRQRVKVKDGTDEVKGQITFMTCCESSCLPPTDIAFAVPLD